MIYEGRARLRARLGGAACGATACGLAGCHEGSRRPRWCPHHRAFPAPTS